MLGEFALESEIWEYVRGVGGKKMAVRPRTAIQNQSLSQGVDHLRLVEGREVWKEHGIQYNLVDDVLEQAEEDGL
jgi:hypothetical protein